MEVVRPVQAIAYSLAPTSDTIPAEFIMPETEQPAANTLEGDAVPEVPTVDMSEADQEEKMAKAAKEWGFFQVVNHGIPSQVISKLQEAGTDFFGLPQQEKEAYAKPPESNSIEGYGTKLSKGTQSWVDHLFHKIWPPSRINYQFWPKNPPSYREANEEYAKYVIEVGNKVFRSLWKGLGVEGSDVEALKEAVGGEELIYMMKINYYPPCPRPDLVLGVPPHTDFSSLTILVPNEVPGLQVFKDDRWIDVPYIPNALIIHVGDQIEIASNGYYKAVLHRTTVDKNKPRMSWPVFLEPPPEFVVGPIPQLLTPQNPPRYNSEMFKDYAYCKLNKLPQ